jgi:hypothetical protein
MVHPQACDLQTAVHPAYPDPLAALLLLLLLLLLLPLLLLLLPAVAVFTHCQNSGEESSCTVAATSRCAIVLLAGSAPPSKAAVPPLVPFAAPLTCWMPLAADWFVTTAGLGLLATTTAGDGWTAVAVPAGLGAAGDAAMTAVAGAAPGLISFRGGWDAPAGVVT